MPDLTAIRHDARKGDVHQLLIQMDKQIIGASSLLAMVLSQYESSSQVSALRIYCRRVMTKLAAIRKMEKELKDELERTGMLKKINESG